MNNLCLITKRIYQRMVILTMQMFSVSFPRVDSMTINGWEMMIPLAFFAGTGYVGYLIFY